MSALHLYGVVGVDKLPTLSAEGAAGRIQLISEGPVAVIVGAAPVRPLRELARDKALPFLLKRQRALEEAMAQTTVLPVRFGTVASDETAVRRMLIEGEVLLKAKLDEFSGSQQFEVAVSWDLEKVFAQIAMESHIFQSLKSLNMETADQKRIEVGAMVKASLDRRRCEYSERLFEELTTVAMDVTENAPSDDGVVANFALLLDRADFASLEGVLNRLDADYAGKLDFRCIGPLPPSAFATVEVDFASARAIGVAWRAAEAGGNDGAVRLILSQDRSSQDCSPGGLPDTDVIVNVVRRVPAVFGAPAPPWRGEGARP
jgi:hypothetical protein